MIRNERYFLDIQYNNDFKNYYNMNKDYNEIDLMKKNIRTAIRTLLMSNFI